MFVIDKKLGFDFGFAEILVRNLPSHWTSKLLCCSVARVLCLRVCEWGGERQCELADDESKVMAAVAVLGNVSRDDEGSSSDVDVDVAVDMDVDALVLLVDNTFVQD